ncbi:hypothetical protein EPO15_02735 [bacterium]|nr:MAG: hypothetical protein EPO15_02735 [bacterium]
MTDRRAALLLAAAVLLAAAFSFSGLGFYNDDYALLSALARGSFTQEFAGLFYTRPLDVPFFGGLFAAFGTTPWPYHLLSRLLDLAAAWAFHRWLREEGADGPTALLAALFFALYPNHDAARCWPSGLVAQGGLAATLGALLLFRTHRALGALAFLGAMLFYEAPSFLVAAVPLAAWLRERDLKKALLPAWPLAAAFAVGAFWQRVLVPLTLAAERHPVSLSPSHALKVLGAGFELTFANRLAHGLARGAQAATGSFSGAEWALFALAGAALAFWAARLALEAEAGPPLLPLAFALFILGYVPYFFDASYMPTAFSANNRLNLTGALGGSLFFAWACARWRRGGPVLAGALAGLFLLENWASNGQYAAAYGRQQEILAAAVPLIPPDAKTLLLYGFEERVGSAVVFESTYDFDGALSLRGARVSARVGQGRMRYDEDAPRLVWYGEAPLSYSGLYAYDHAARKMTALPGPAAAREFLAKR